VLAAALAEAGARVIAVDVPGRGRSSRLPDPNLYTPPSYALYLAAFCAKLGLARIDWVGTSMGGIIGMMLAANPATSIARLVLNDVGPFIDKGALDQIASYVGLDLRFDTLDELERHLRTIHAGFGALSDAQWRHMATHGARQDADGWRLSYDPAIRTPYAGRAAADVDMWPLWEQIRCPTFVLRGGESRILTAETARRMAETGPRAVVRTLPGIGHAPGLMDPEQVRIVKDFLVL
jgi:pimeloyl-ACP methyl ester carboxylesterase